MTWVASDIDIAVLFDEEKSSDARFSSILRLIGDLTAMFRTENVDVVDIAEAPIVMRYHILRDGVVIHCSDQRQRVSFYCRSISMYLDFAPSREVHYRYLIRRIKAGRFGERVRYKRHPRAA